MFSAVLDACTLFPQSLRDILLRLAQAELYAPVWSGRILDEMSKNLVENRGIAPEKVERTRELMCGAFPEAEVDAKRIEALEGAMTNDEKDRHVLAAAVVAGSEAVVTFNQKHFLPEDTERVGVDALHPDQFLTDIYDLDPEATYRVIAELTTRLRATTFDEFLAMLEAAGVPRFAAAVRAHRARRVGGGT